MNVLLLGSGGREHAYAHYIAKSSKLTQLFIAPGNAGTALCGTNCQLNPIDFEAVLLFCNQNSIDLIIPGNEDPLVAGIVDYFASHAPHILVAGPNKWCAQLEGSKSFSKQFMAANNIPTAAYMQVSASNLSQGKAFLETMQAPYVLKADGLAAGKGVLIIDNLQQAQAELENMIVNQVFGNASNTVVIEEFLQGIEISVFVISDGKDYQILGSAKDYKRIGEGDTGLNTGGMGAISPVPFANQAFMDKVTQRIIEPTIKGLQAAGNPYQGILFIGLMNCNGNPYVIEYNVRMGDPETEAIFPRLQVDMLHLMHSVATQQLHTVAFSHSTLTAATVFLVSQGYPQSYAKNIAMQLPSQLPPQVVLLHAGTTMHQGNLVTNGGRVIAITALENTLNQAIQTAMHTAQQVQYQGKYYRTDIGQDLLAYTHEK